MNQINATYYQLTIVLNQPDEDKVQVLRELAVLSSDDMSVSVPVDRVTDDVAYFGMFISDYLSYAHETDHLLFVFASDIHYSQNLYFQTFLEFVQTLFVYDITESCQDLGVYMANYINFELFSPLYAYLKLRDANLTVRASLIYVSSREHFPLLRRELKNVFTGAMHSSYLSQVTRVFGIVSNATKRDFQRDAAVLFYYVKEMHLLRIARKETGVSFDELGIYFSNNSMYKKAFVAWRRRVQKCGLLWVFLIALRRAVPKCAPFYACLDKYSGLESFTCFSKAKYLLQRNSRQLGIQTTKSNIREHMTDETSRRPLDVMHLTDEELERNARDVSLQYARKYAAFGRLVKSVLRDSVPFLKGYWNPPVDIYVNIYHIIQSDIPSKLGIGIYHSALEIGPLEVAFGGHPYAGETGVFFIAAKKMSMGARFYKQQYIGKCYLTKMQVYEEILRRIPLWPGTGYELLHCNCNDFTDEMCVALTGKRMPGYINRAASIGAVFKKSAVQKLGSLYEVVMWQGNENSDDSADDQQNYPTSYATVF